MSSLEKENPAVLNEIQYQNERDAGIEAIVMTKADATMAHWQISEALIRMAHNLTNVPNIPLPGQSQASDEDTFQRPSSADVVRARNLLEISKSVVRTFLNTLEKEFSEKRLIASRSATVPKDFIVIQEFVKHFGSSALAINQYMIENQIASEKISHLAVTCKICNKHVLIKDLKIMALDKQGDTEIAIHCMPMKAVLEDAISRHNIDEVVDAYISKAIVLVEDGAREKFFGNYINMVPSMTILTFKNIFDNLDLIFVDDAEYEKLLNPPQSQPQSYEGSPKTVADFVVATSKPTPEFAEC